MVGEIAEICQVTPTTVYRWAMEGKFRSFKTAGGHNRVWEEDAVALLESLQIPSSRLRRADAPPKILIVDDEAFIRRLIRRQLEPLFPEAIFDEASDGYEAGFKTRDQKPALVVLDLVLPGIDGFNVCRLVKSNEDLKDTKILAISGYRQEIFKKMSLKAGADAFLPKPLDRNQLINLVKDLLSKYLA